LKQLGLQQQYTASNFVKETPKQDTTTSNLEKEIQRLKKLGIAQQYR
jgi:hypothetical protein